MSGLELLLNIGGGVALLLWATRMIRTGIMRAYGAEVRRGLGRSTKNPFAALGMGVGIAALLQSSTATAILAVSFAGRKLIAIPAGLALMLGADVGSTLVVQVLSFDISWLSPLFILAGVIAFLSTDGQLLRHLGRVMIGLGLMLLSLSLIVGASVPLRESEALAVVIEPLANDPIFAATLAALFTWLAHSSVAMVLLFMSLTATSVVPLALGLALVLGANIGAGIVPMMLTFSASPLARRIPFGNLLFRAIGAFAILPFVSLMIPLLEMLDGDPARQIANFHTFFNLALAAVCLPFIAVMARFAAKVFPESDAEVDEARPRFLDPDAIDSPKVALANATRESLRMADLVENMLREVIDVFRNNDTLQAERASELDDAVDELHEAIKLYLSKVSRHQLDEEESDRCIELITFITNLEHIGDIIDKNLLEIAVKKIKKRLIFSAEGWEELESLHARVTDQMQLAMNVFVSGDVHLARELLRNKEEFRELERSSSELHLERLRSGKVESIETSALHLDMLRDLKRINSHLTSVAYPILDAEGELRKSRLKGRGKSARSAEKKSLSPESAPPQRSAEEPT